MSKVKLQKSKSSKSLKSLKFKSLKTKLIVSTAMIVFVTAILNLVIGFYASYKSLTQNVESDLQSIGEMADVAITNALNNISLTVESVAKYEIIGKTDSNQSEVLSMLKKEAEEQEYLSLSIVDKSGKIISSDSSFNDKSVADQEYFKKAIAGETYISTTTYDLNNQLCVIVCTPVNNENNYSGVVMATVNPQIFSKIINGIKIGKSGNVFMLDKEGAVIANMRPELVESRANFIEKAKTDSKYETAATVYKNMVAGKSAVEIYAYETGDRICYYAPLANTDGWSYGAVAPISEMTSTIWYTIAGLAISSLLCIVIGVLLTIIVSKSIVNPISIVCQRLELLAEGDLHTDTVEVNAIDETGILASSLNKTVTSLRGYITDITETLHEVSIGNMLVKVSGDFHGDFAPIKESLSTITESLDEVLSDIDRAAEQVSSSSEQVSGSAQALAQGATEQASSVEELAATIAEISSNVKNNADNATEADKNVNDVRSEIEVSNRHMQDMVVAMSKIDKSSNEIGKIIKTIEDIAFQTNILALNAAVEAARAGSAGKGFAVVADEVRNLASKSAEAAKNTTVLIENSIQQVENGSRILDETAKSLLKVVENTKVVANTVNQISEASTQQADAISQVTMGVDQIACVVQTNSATAEESAASSEELSGQAQIMKSLVSKFKLKKDC